MNTRALGPVAGLLGGLSWVLCWLLDLGTWDEPVRWTGMVLLGLALAVVGAGLVSTSALGLRVLVAVAFPLLVWSLLSAVTGTGDAAAQEGALEGVVGLLAVAASARALVVARRDGEAEHGMSAPPRGSHAAR